MQITLLDLPEELLLKVLLLVGNNGVERLLLTCEAFLRTLVVAATDTTVTADAASLMLRHSRALQRLTLKHCTRLPWDAAPGPPAALTNPHATVSSLTQLVFKRNRGAICYISDAEATKLSYLSRLCSLDLSGVLTSKAILGAVATLTSLKNLRLAWQFIPYDLFVYLSSPP